MKIFFIRHGESEHNKYMKDLRKSEDPANLSKVEKTEVSLSEEGRKQAASIAEKLPEHFDVIYSSHHLRVKETADILIQQKYSTVPIEYCQDLRECSMGELDGMTLEVMDEKIGYSLAHAFNTNTYDFSPHGGESQIEFDARVKNFLLDILSKPHPNALVVTSHGFIKSVYHLLFGKIAINILENIRVKNASVHEFDLNIDDIKTPA